jgi:radical SAM protein with 4Fe4S-binding SPASM domain
MDLGVPEMVAREIKRLEIHPRLSFSGFGEPLLHKHLSRIIQSVSQILPEHIIEVNTNGDRLTAARIRELFDVGLSFLYVNMYDGSHQVEELEALFTGAGVPRSQWKLRPHWTGSEDDFGLTLNNRAGSVHSATISLRPLDRPLSRACNYPFYKLLVDWNGDVLFCSNDWGREIVVGNVLNLSLDEIWLGRQMFEIRKNLAEGDRSRSPCNKCNVDGLLTGNESADILMEYLEQQGNHGLL